MKDLAVIMSLYKNDRLVFLKQAINSVLNQTYSDFDFFIQCDGNVSEECELYLDSLKDERIIVRKRSVNKGLAFSLNEMLKIVIEKGYKYVARMDADDICMLDRFKKQIEYIYANQEIDILGGCIEEINEENESIQFIQYPFKHELMKEFFGKRNPLAHMTVLFRSSYFNKAGIYPENTRLDEDTMFWFSGFMNHCIFANLSDILVRVRVNSDFYERRNGFTKSYFDFKNRLCIIKDLQLSKLNYIWAFSRFVIMSLPFSGITKFVYRVFRK